MENIFGITSTQAGRSNLGYRVYEADAGIKDVGASLSLRHFLTRNVGITTRLGYAQLLGDAADSQSSMVRVMRVNFQVSLP